MENKDIKILVVDDLYPNLYLMEAILEDVGYQTLTASSGKEALEIIEKELPNLVLLDIMIPDMNGIEILEWIKSNEKTSKIPVIMVSALREIDIFIDALSRGAIDYIKKPIEQKVLLTKIEMALLPSEVENSGDFDKQIQ
jgi:CheY-like chemotaxis protein